MRKIVDARDARVCVDSARALGMSLGAWARRHGVDGRSLHAWAVNLGRSSSRSRSLVEPRLIELVPSSSPSPVRRYVVHVGDGQIELGDDFHEETLARIVRVLRTC